MSVCFLMRGKPFPHTPRGFILKIWSYYVLTGPPRPQTVSDRCCHKADEDTIDLVKEHRVSVPSHLLAFVVFTVYYGN